MFNTTRNALISYAAQARKWNILYNFTGIIQPSSKRWKWIVVAERFEFVSRVQRKIMYFVDTELQCQLKKDRYSIGLEIRNLLNNNQIEQLTLANFSISRSRQILQERWAMLRLQLKW